MNTTVMCKKDELYISMVEDVFMYVAGKALYSTEPIALQGHSVLNMRQHFPWSAQPCSISKLRESLDDSE